MVERKTVSLKSDSNCLKQCECVRQTESVCVFSCYSRMREVDEGFRGLAFLCFYGHKGEKGQGLAELPRLQQAKENRLCT